MTKEEFAALQLSHRESGKTLKELLKDLGVAIQPTTTGAGSFSRKKNHRDWLQ